MDDIKIAIANRAIDGATVCLAVYFVIAVSTLIAAVVSATKVALKARQLDAGNEQTSTWAEIAKVIPAIIDSLVKGGPAFYSLVGSMLFLLIASLAAGVFPLK